MGANTIFKNFVDEETGVSYLLVEVGLRSSLWNKDEYTSNDLREEIENWLRKYTQTDEDRLYYGDNEYED